MEGQKGSGDQSGHDMSDVRQHFTMSAVGNGQILESIWPRTPDGLHLIDPVQNIHRNWPPTAIVHGTKDIMIPFELSEYLESQLRLADVETELIAVPGEPHTFAGPMVKDSPTWRTQREGFDFLERVLNRSYDEGNE